MYDIITALDVCIDFLVTGVPEPRFGQVEQIVEDYQFELGGSSAIFASQCAKLGLKAIGVGIVGDDYLGQIYIDRLKNTGVDTAGLVKSRSIKTGVGIALCNKGDRAILTYLGTIDKVSADMLEKHLHSARHLHIASYYLQTEIRPYWLELIRKAKAKGMTVSLDTNWDPAEKWDGLDEILKEIDVFLPNEQEAKYFAGTAQVEDALHVLQQKTPVVAIKLGKNGAMSSDSGQLLVTPAWPGEPVDTIGAGDNFDAGFIYAWLSGASIEKCLEAGCYCGGKSVAGQGGINAQPNLGELKEALKL